MSNSSARTREHLANERTFLAWIRTSISLMGLGFVIVKFTFFLKQISLVLDSYIMLSNKFSSKIGVTMIAIGILMSVSALWQFKRNQKQINDDVFISSSLLSLIITLIILIGGVIMIAYLLTSL